MFVNAVHVIDVLGDLWSFVVRKKEFRLKRFISQEEINLLRQKQNYRFYVFDKSWNYSVNHVIYKDN